MPRTPPFTDRGDAGRQLAMALPPIDPANAVVLALPRGGVPVAAEICRHLGSPLDLVLVRKIGLPGEPEVAVGAIADGRHPLIVVNSRIAEARDLSKDQVDAMGQMLLPEIERQRRLYLQDRDRPTRAGKTLIVVDDGAATGATARVALLAARAAKPGRLILALPVAPPEVIAALSELADDVICLERPRPFWSVGTCYRDFAQVTDIDVVEALRRCAGSGPAPAGLARKTGG